MGDEYRMWYAGYDRAATRQACYAVSKDGIEWTGHRWDWSTYNGNTANNLLSIDGDQPIKSALFFVLHDPEDPDPAKRFKMLRERDPENSIKAAFSPDGLRLDEGRRRQVHHRGGAERPGEARRPVLHERPRRRRSAIRSTGRQADDADVRLGRLRKLDDGGRTCSFRRDNPPPTADRTLSSTAASRSTPAAAIWNRGNVFLGFFTANTTARPATAATRGCDIGLVVSNDALHFKEPLPDFRIVPSAEELDRASHG